ncbi:hypothetical protein PMAC_001318 [Pneumocystis sp. 'macacae']|nr:hypothetical protein PMAC_001318 [Pneumocystis sp. 'macacae']
MPPIPPVQTAASGSAAPCSSGTAGSPSVQPARSTRRLEWAATVPVLLVLTVAVLPYLLIYRALAVHCLRRRAAAAAGLSALYIYVLWTLDRYLPVSRHTLPHPPYTACVGRWLLRVGSLGVGLMGLVSGAGAARAVLLHCPAPCRCMHAAWRRGGRYVFGAYSAYRIAAHAGALWGRCAPRTAPGVLGAGLAAAAAWVQGAADVCHRAVQHAPAGQRVLLLASAGGVYGLAAAVGVAGDGCVLEQWFSGAFVAGAVGTGAGRAVWVLLGGQRGREGLGRERVSGRAVLAHSGPLNYARAVAHAEGHAGVRAVGVERGTGERGEGEAVRGRRAQRSSSSPSRAYKGGSRQSVQRTGEEGEQGAGAGGEQGGHQRRNSSMHSNRSSLSPCQGQTVYPYAYHASPYFFAVPPNYAGVGAYASHGGHSGYTQRGLGGLPSAGGHAFNGVSSPPVVATQAWQSMNQHYFYQSGYEQGGFYQPLYGISSHSFVMPMGSYGGMLYPYGGQGFQQTGGFSGQTGQMGKSVSSGTEYAAGSTLGASIHGETGGWTSQVPGEETPGPGIVRPQKRVNAAVKIVNPKTNMEILISPTQSAQDARDGVASLALDEACKDIDVLSGTGEEKRDSVVVPEKQAGDDGPSGNREEQGADDAVGAGEKSLSARETEVLQTAQPGVGCESSVAVGEGGGFEEEAAEAEAEGQGSGSMSGGVEKDGLVGPDQEKNVAEPNEKEDEFVEALDKNGDSAVAAEGKEESVSEYCSVYEEAQLTEENNVVEKDTVEKDGSQKDILEENEAADGIIENSDMKDTLEKSTTNDILEENAIQDGVEKNTVEDATGESAFCDSKLNFMKDEDLKPVHDNVDSTLNTQGVDQSHDYNVTELQDKSSQDQSCTTKQSSLPSEKTKQKTLPAPLDLSKTSRNDARAVSVSINSLKNAEFITDLTTIVYPEKFKPPDKSLNVNSLPGKFRYNEDFLLQFQKVFKDKPDHNWDERIRDTIGDGTDDKKASKNSLGGLSSRSISRSIGVSMTSIPIGTFGLSKASLSKSSSNQHCQYASAQVQQGLDALSSNMDELAGSGAKSTSNNKSMSSSGVALSDSGSPVVSRFSFTGSNNSASSSFPMSGSGSPVTPKMSSRKGSRRGTGLSQSEFKGDKHDQKTGANAFADHVVPLTVSANRWQPKLKSQTIQPGEHMDPETVQRKVKAALNKLTLDNFDRITDQILEIASQSKNETDGRTLRQIIQLTFEKATDEANFSSMYARFCRKMMETTSPEIRDEKLQLDKNGRPITGGILFRKYLLNRCQENFERGWKANLPSKPNSDPSSSQEAEMLSDEYYVLVAAKRRGLGLIKFIGELFKLNMLTERIMHECIKKLLANVVDPDEEEIESLCKLLTTIGKDLESTEKGHLHMNVYIERMDKIVKTSNLSNRIKFMVMVGWKSKNADKGPKTIAEIHEDIAKEKAEAEATRLINQNRGSRLDFGRMDKSGRSNISLFGVPDWQNSKNFNSTDSKAGDLSRLGQIRSSNQKPYGPGGQLSSLRSLSESKKFAFEPHELQKELSHSSQTSATSNAITLEQKSHQNIVLLPKTEYVLQNNQHTSSQEADVNLKNSTHSMSLSDLSKHNLVNSKDILELVDLKENVAMQTTLTRDSKIVQNIDSDDETTSKEHFADSEKYETALEKFADSEESPVA